MRIAKNNKKISDIAFKDQVIATVTQIENIYWDLVSAYEQTQVNEQSSAFAQQTLDNARKQLQLESIPEMDVLRAEAEVSKRDQDLTVARTSLQLQETLMKNAITKSLDDPVLEAMPVVPTDRMEGVQPQTTQSIQDLISEALHDRTGTGRVRRRPGKPPDQPPGRAQCLAAFTVAGGLSIRGSGLAGLLNPVCPPRGCTSNVPLDFGGALTNTFNNSSPDYYVGLNLNIPLRNRVAKADQYRSELEYRQAELRLEQLKKQVRIEVRNAQYAVEQTGARVQAARKARDLAQRTFDITKKEQDLGAGSSYQTLSAQRDLALAELDLVTAMTIFEKAKVELDRATGATLEHNGIQLQNAVTGTVAVRVIPSARREPITSHANFRQTGRTLRREPGRCEPRKAQLRAAPHPGGRRPAARSRSSRTPLASAGIRSGNREIPGAGSRCAGHRVSTMPCSST